MRDLISLQRDAACSAFRFLDEGCPRCWALLHSAYTEEVGFCLHQVFTMHEHLSERRDMSPSYCEGTVASNHLGNSGTSPDTKSVGLDLGHSILGAMSSLWRYPVIATLEDHSKTSSIFTGGQDLLVTLSPKTIHPSSSPPPPPSPNPSPVLKGPVSVLLMLISCWPRRHFRELKQLARPLPGLKGTADVSLGTQRPGKRTSNAESATPSSRASC